MTEDFERGWHAVPSHPMRPPDDDEGWIDVTKVVKRALRKAGCDGLSRSIGYVALHHELRDNMDHPLFRIDTDPWVSFHFLAADPKHPATRALALAMEAAAEKHGVRMHCHGPGEGHPG